jgi:hypothetical protein
MQTLPCLLALLILIPVFPAVADGAGGLVGLQIGGSFPTDEFGRVVDNGWEGGFTATTFGLRNVGIGVDVAYHRWSGSLDSTPLGTPLLGPGWRVDVNAIQYTAHLMFMPRIGGKLRPYARSGTGFYWLRSDLSRADFSAKGDWDPSWTYHVGAGVILDGTPSDLGIGATYQVIQDSGADLTFYTVAASLMWGGGPK